MSDDARQWIGDYLRKVAANDADGVNAYYADDLTFHLLGRSTLAGDHDKERLLTLLAEYYRDRDVKTEPLAVLTGDGYAAAVVRTTVSHAGGSYTGLRVALYRLEGERIHEVWTFDEDQRAYDAAVDNP